jgi:hypothetical protein
MRFAATRSRNAAALPSLVASHLLAQGFIRRRSTTRWLAHQLVFWGCGPELRGNAYEAEGVPRVPSTLVEAIAALEGSELAAKAFGEDVHLHLVNTARQEWAASNRVVTDWELRRSFELA